MPAKFRTGPLPGRQPARGAASAPSLGPPDPLAFELLNEVGIISQLSQNRATRLMAPALNMSQFSLLNHFTRLGGERSLVQLAGALQVTKAAMTNTVGRLRDKGLLEVRPDPVDGRGKLVSLTPLGMAARQLAVAQLGRELAGLGAELSADEMAAALLAMRKLRVWFDQHR